jgi:GT2 family glycosyltransferase
MIDVVTPIFNRPDYTAAFLDAMASARHGAKLRLILVDNASRRRTTSLLVEASTRLPQENPDVEAVEIVKLPKNAGFPGGVNAGMELAGGPFACVLHNDTLPFDGWAGTMEAHLSGAEEEVAAVMPMTTYANEWSVCVREKREAFEKIKPSNKNRMDADEIKEVVEKIFPEGQEEFLAWLRSEYPETMYCPEIASFCLMMRTELFAEYGGFCEEFWPRGYEDKLWLVAAQRDGFVCEISSWAFCHHFGNVTSDGPGFSFPNIAERNEKLFAIKYEELDALEKKRLKQR